MEIVATKDGKIFVNGEEKKLYARSRKNPYPCFSIQSKLYNVHRLVAEQHIPNPLNKPCVNHKNGIKTDNRVENLEWATYSENVKHGYDILGVNHNSDYLRVLTDIEVNQIRKKYIPKVYSMAKLSKEYGVSVATIHRVINKTLNY
jgi:hypothetical protein